MPDWGVKTSGSHLGEIIDFCPNKPSMASPYHGQKGIMVFCHPPVFITPRRGLGMHGRFLRYPYYAPPRVAHRG